MTKHIKVVILLEMRVPKRWFLSGSYLLRCS